jgi:hypothetical protein
MSVCIGVVCKNDPDTIAYLYRISDGFEEKIKEELINAYNSVEGSNVVDFCIKIQNKSCDVDFEGKPFCPYAVSILKYVEITDCDYVFKFDEKYCAFRNFCAPKKVCLGFDF